MVLENQAAAPGKKTMLVVMQSHATPGQIDGCWKRFSDGPDAAPDARTDADGHRHHGQYRDVDSRRLEVLPGVLELIRVTKPYKLASREMHRHDTVISPASGSHRRSSTFTIIAGPCSVENEAMLLRTAEWLMARGIRFLRAGAFKPRTSPYAFQGLGLEGLEILRRARERTGIGIVTELMDTDTADAVEDAADIIQIGTRNMQNYSLLRRVSRARKPVLAQAGHVGHARRMADVG